MNQLNNNINKAGEMNDNKVESKKVENIKVTSKSNFTISSFNFETIKSYIYIIISAIVILSSLFLLIIPQYSNLSENQAELEKLQTELESVANLREYLESLASLEDELDENIKISHDALSREEDEIPYILDQLIQISELSGSSVESLSLSGAPDSANVKEGEPVPIRIQMSIVGEFDKIRSFLGNLESARRIIKVNSFQFSNKAQSRENTDVTGQSASGPIFTLNMSLIAYIMRDVDTKSISIKSSTSVPRYEGVVVFLKEKRLYEPKSIPVFIESENPFEQIVDLQNGDNEDNTSNDVEGSSGIVSDEN